MAGFGKHGRKHGQKRGKKRQNNSSAGSKKQKKNFKNQDNDHSSMSKARKPDVLPVHKEIEESSSSSESESEEKTAYQQLMSTVNVENRPDSASETEESEEEDEEIKEGMQDNAGVEKADVDDDEDNIDDDGVVSESGSDIDNESDIDNDRTSGNHSSVLKDDIQDGDNSESDDDVKSEQGDGDDEDDVGVHSDDEDENVTCDYSDPFSAHFENVLPDEVADRLAINDSWSKEETKIPTIGRCIVKKPKDLPTQFTCNNVLDKDLASLHLKKKLLDHLYEVNKKCVPELGESDKLTAFQHQMLNLVNNYKDVYYPMRERSNAEEIRLVYCLHAVNHVLKTRSRVIAHNTKLKTKKGDLSEEYRDQGLTRPKVLIVVPFRDSALRIVNIISNLLMSKDESFITNKKRFQKEYGSKDDEEPPSGKKPEDFEATFKGNVDDHFRMGLGVAKKSLKLYTEFYSSDIIVASPLGLRTVIGADGEEDRDFDFLSSIELMIFDQADVLLMQNWDHIVHLMSHVHQQPKEAHGVDFSRVRMWTLNGWSKFYRQTLVYSSIVCPEVTALFNKHCHNFAGKLTVLRPPSTGTISQVVTQLPQVFQRIECSSLAELAETRLNYFFKKVVPHHKEAVMAQTLVFIPSYFDYVRVRNTFKKKEIHCEFLCEYTNDKGISRARHFFFHGNTAFMLYTERLHFYRRFRIRGVKHIVFYELPRYPHFYSELCNMLQDRKRGEAADDMTCTILYSKYDAQKLAEIVGMERATHMLNSQKTVHMFVTGEK